jgi:uncharacterized membrane protein
VIRFSTFRLVILSVLFCFVLATALVAQNSGALRGRVVDPSGAVVPNAVISAKSSTGQEMTATSTGDGSYEIKGLAPGQYSISVSAKGFAAFTKSVTVAAARQTLDIALEISALGESKFLPNREPTNITGNFSSTKIIPSLTRETRLLPGSPIRPTTTPRCTRGTSAVP